MPARDDDGLIEAAATQMATSTTLTVTVVIPCLNEEEHIEQLLAAVRRQDYPLHEVIAVDTGSTDGTHGILESIRSRHPELPLSILFRPGATIPEALNAGAASAIGEIIARLDAHSCPIDSCIRLLVVRLMKTSAGVVGGVWKIAPEGTGAMAQAIGRAVSHPLRAGDAAYRIGLPDGAPRNLDTVPFGCYRRATWNGIGGYNEKLLANEDYEFNYRVKLGGQQVLLDPGICCNCVARATLKELAIQYFRYGWWKAERVGSDY